MQVDRHMRQHARLRGPQGPREGSCPHTSQWAEGMLQAICEQSGENFSEFIREIDSLIPDDEINSMSEVTTKPRTNARSCLFTRYCVNM